MDHDFDALRDLRTAHDRIKRDLECGHCSLERLRANLAVFDSALAELEKDETPYIELTDAAVAYIGAANARARARRASFEVIEGDRP